jgi:uncharacterized 2Fe-2S/4Fe-4S cluster protein (DUF4445 family)
MEKRTDTLTVLDHEGRERHLPIKRSATLAQAVYTSGEVPAPALCSGLGRCGRCRVRFLGAAPEPLPEDLALLGAHQVEAGWRLGCKHPPQGGARLELPPRAARMRPQGPLATTTAEKGRLQARLALDLGTTSMQWRCLAGGDVVLEGRELNPQMGAGSEVMSRLAFAAAPGNAARLRRLVLDLLHNIRQELEEHGVELREMCIAGNSVMTLLLLGRPLEGLARAPYSLEYRAGESVILEQGLPPVYLPPLIAPFVGADLAAGLTHVCHGLPDGAEYPFVLADLGTNGEFILGLDKGRFLATSVPLGPALEGVGLSHGSLAEPGAVVRFDLHPGTGLVPRYFEDIPAGFTGVTGSGYLSLLRRLRDLGLLREDGGLNQSTSALTPLGTRLMRRLIQDDRGWRLPLPLQVEVGEHDTPPCLWPRDVEEILKVKAACDLALSRLLAEAGLPVHGLRRLYLAGAMGEHLGVDNLEVLGFLPPGMGSRTRILGNSSLQGAALLLQHPELRQWLHEAASRVRTLDLAGAADFGEQFFKRMRFVYTA